VGLNEMADLTKCSIRECPARKKCLRSTVEPSENQSYFEPDVDEEGCEYFIPVTKEMLDEN
jgi:hypothetical protein